MLEAPYTRLAKEYDWVFRADAERVWRSGIMTALTAIADISALVDVGCGTGVGARVCREMGVTARITGTDPSAAMLAIAAPHYERVVESGAGGSALANTKFDCVVCGYDAFNYIMHSRVRNVLRSFRDCLAEPGRRVIIDFLTPHYAISRELHGIIQKGDKFVSWKQMLLHNNLLKSEIVCNASGRTVWAEEHVQNLFTPAFIRREANASGLRVIDLEEFEDDQGRFLLVAER